MPNSTLGIYIGIAAVIAVIFLVYHLGQTSVKNKSRYRDIARPTGSRNQDQNEQNLLPRGDSGEAPPNLPLAENRDRRQHPVLEYQRRASYDTHPANYGDPIRPLGIGASPAPSRYTERYDSRVQPRSKKSSRDNAYAYDSPGDGPYPGKPLNVPVPQASLKMSSEKYSYPFHYQKKPLSPYDYFKPYGPNSPEMQNEIVYADTPFYKRQGEEFATGYTGSGAIPFISSVNSFAPFPEVQTAWEKTGMIQTEDKRDTTIMSLYRKPISAINDLFEYTVQDKDGFVVPLKVNYLEDGDTIKSVPGREALGPWKVNIYVNNKWVWA